MNPVATDFVTQHTPKQVESIAGDRQCTVARYSPDGDTVWAGGYDGLIRRWNLTAEKAVALEPLKAHHGWVTAVEFAAASPHVFTTDSWGRLTCWKNAEESKSVWTHESAHDGWIRGITLDAEGKSLATFGKDQIARVWSRDGKLLREFAGHESEVLCAAFHPDGNSLVTGDFFGHVIEWDLDTGKQLRTKQFEKFHFAKDIQDVAGLRLLGFHDDGKTMFAAGSHPTNRGQMQGIPTLQFFSWPDWKETATVTFGDTPNIGYVFDLVWHTDGFWIAVTSGTPGNGQVVLHRPGDREPFFRFTKLSNCHSISLHPDGKRFLVASTNRNSQGNGAVRDKEGNYLGNSSPLTVFAFPSGEGE